MLPRVASCEESLREQGSSISHLYEIVQRVEDYIRNGLDPVSARVNWLTERCQGWAQLQLVERLINKENAIGCR